MTADALAAPGPAGEESPEILSARLDRRSVVQAAAMTAGAATLGLSPWATGAADAALVRRLRRSTFAPLVGRGFSVTGHGVSRRLVLREVADLEYVPRLPRSERAAYREKSFTLRFSRQRALPAGTYRLSHPRLGTAEVFLSPVGPETDRLVEAIFNRYQG